MKNKFIIVLIATGALLIMSVFVVMGKQQVVTERVPSEERTPAIKTRYTPGGTATAPADFEMAAQAGVPSVVHIRTVIRNTQVSGKKLQQNPFGDLFGNDDMFRRFFGDNGGSIREPEQDASGSGVIISKDGYIVTNHHVVDGATEVTVTLDDHKNYKATIVGTDANTDLALIKIDAHDLPVMSIGNSDDVHLGQWVLAIGYPLNLDVTVTQGIVSGKSRSIGINRQGKAPVEAFIQTDAAVNPGSSGGALVNTNGELVGITAAIASPTGAYAGYAYSIPSNLMKKIIGDIMKYGTVQRGYLGISMAPPDMEDAQKKELGVNDDIRAVWVMETDPQGAAAGAGIKKGDAITAINGQPVSSNAELSELIARQKPGDKVLVTLLRGKEEKKFTVALQGKIGNFPSQQTAAIESLGASFRSVKKEDAARMHIAGGVQVTQISREGIIGQQTAIKDGFVITKIGGIAVRSVDEMKEALAKQASNFQVEGLYPGSDAIYFYGINDFRQ